MNAQVLQGLKRCTKCKLPKPNTDFYSHNATHDRLRPECKLCGNRLGYAARLRRIDDYRAWRSEYNNRPHVREYCRDALRVWRARRKRLARIHGRMPKDNHPPSFPFYVDDFIADSSVDAMTNEELGIYIRLLCKAWKESPVGTIPADDLLLARWAKVTPRAWARLRESILRAFVLDDASGRYRQKRMQLEWEKLLERREKQSQAGTKGATSRWQPHGNPNGKPIAGGMAKNGLSPSPSVSPSIKTPPPPVPPAVDGSKLRRALEEEVFECGVEDARRCVGRALESGCTADEIRAVILAWCRRKGDLGPGSLHYRLMDLKPGDDPERTWPKPEPVVQAKKHAATVADRERAAEQEHAKKLQSEKAVIEARERRFGDQLDMMDRSEVEEIVRHNAAMHGLFKKKQPSGTLRDWLLVQLEKRAEILS